MQKYYELGMLSRNLGLITRWRWKIKDMDLEEMLLEWITLQRSKNLRVSQKLIQRKARINAEKKSASKGQMNDFRSSEGWLGKFVLKRVIALLSQDPGTKNSRANN